QDAPDRIVKHPLLDADGGELAVLKALQARAVSADPENVVGIFVDHHHAAHASGSQGNIAQIKVEKRSVAEEADPAVCTDPQIAQVVFRDGPHAIAAQAFLGGVIDESAVMQAVRAAGKSPSPDIAGAVLVHGLDEVVNESVRFRIGPDRVT